ncbi:o-succinylbenzoate synthase [Microbacterium dextranolyticum]|uniref:o-succinylbenzoate synthase n=1 Tax=Microbacterium dextranolyticum TaxID=36806 RepID=A0A9W6HJJ9_9MICO|nr:o-succinylbenzoate synthase [Microbacterium dextranolyticum]MBM7461909.1 O-succinylbenzoate synthase [Microbacterium dextranolyticum]GLJ94148.1 o-succinylbenzoate synthase [Microbacterium dextranolyticum]
MPITRPAAPVRLEAVELRVLHLPLVSPFTTSFGTESVREVIVVRARTSDGEGWGEIVTQESPLYSSEYTRGAWDVANRFLVPALLDAGSLAPEDVSGILAPCVGHRMVKAGLELAVLDAALRAEDRSLGAYLGAAVDRVPSGVSVGIQRDPAALVDAVGGYLDEGYVRIKIKIKPGRDVADTAAVRDAFGAIPLQVDANSAYTLADVDTLAELDRFDLLLIEQPLQEDDIVDHATLAARLRTPVCLDESIVSAKAAADALALRAASVINIKAGRVGGYLEAVRVHDLCREAGVPVWCGGMLETGIGRAANAALAALPGFTLPGDVSASDRFYTRDIVTEPIRLEDGHVRVPTGPGIGIEIDPVALDDVTVDRVELRR